MIGLYQQIGYVVKEPKDNGADMSILTALIENGTRYNLVEIYRDGEFVEETGELRRAINIIGQLNCYPVTVDSFPEYTENGEPTGRTILIIEIA